MPLLREGGNFVYGWSIIRKDNTLYLPPKVVNEYKLEKDNDIILFSGSKISGGFCITSLKTLKSSKLSRVVENNPDLENEENIGKIINYGGRSYCHLKLTDENSLILSDKIMTHFNMKNGNKLLIIKGSRIAISCCLKGPLIKVAHESNKLIEVY